MHEATQPLGGCIPFALVILVAPVVNIITSLILVAVTIVIVLVIAIARVIVIIVTLIIIAGITTTIRRRPRRPRRPRRLVFSSVPPTSTTS